MKPGDKLDTLTCRAVQSILSRVGDKWTVLIVAMLQGGPARFNELRRSIDGISQRMLTLTLRSLERDGLVSRTVHPTIPPRVDYALTETGRTLTAPMIALAEWAVSQRDAIEGARERFDKRNAKKDAAERRVP
jgi:DNA-binding HxlR family transcriptional regulator